MTVVAAANMVYAVICVGGYVSRLYPQQSSK